MSSRIPSQEAPLDKATGLFDVRWLTWFRDLTADVDASSQRVPSGTVQEEGLTASIGTTPIPTADLVEGLYRASWYLQVTTPAGVSSSAQVTLSWTRDSDAQSKVGAANNGNLTTTYEANSVPLIHIDPASPVSYAINYASNPAAAMVYEFNLVLELVSADN